MIKLRFYIFNRWIKSSCKIRYDIIYLIELGIKIGYIQSVAANSYMILFDIKSNCELNKKRL